MTDNGTPLQDNPYVKELFSTLQDNGKDASGLIALLCHINDMEKYVKRADDTISEMKSQLADMKEVQKHPVKTALQNAIKTLEQKVADIKGRLAALKNSIVDGCKKAVATFKAKGIVALDKIASFFQVKQDLQDWNKRIEGIIRTDDKAIAKIESFANEYHSAGKHVRNIARLAVGKQPIDTKKEAGKLAKTIAAPYKAQKAAVTGLKKPIEKAIAKLEQLEKNAAAIQVERTAAKKPVVAKKPSVLGQLRENIALVNQAKREAPMQERLKVKGAEL